MFIKSNPLPISNANINREKETDDYISEGKEGMLNGKPIEIFKGNSDYLLVYTNENNQFCKISYSDKMFLQKYFHSIYPEAQKI